MSASAPLLGRPWALRREALDAVLADLRAGPRPAAARPPTTLQVERSDGTAVVPVVGVLGWRPDLISELLGWTSLSTLGATLRTLADDRRVERIVLDFSSPGGSVDGVEETAALIRSIRRRKPVIGIADVEACSAAYWLLASCSEAVAMPSGAVASVGVILALESEARLLDATGVDVAVITAPGPAKAEGHPALPLSEPAVARAQAVVDRYYRAFRAGVALGRRVSERVVDERYGSGRYLLADEALVDAVGTLDDVLAGRTPLGVRRRRADLEVDALRVGGPAGLGAVLDARRRRRQLAAARARYGV